MQAAIAHGVQGPTTDRTSNAAVLGERHVRPIGAAVFCLQERGRAGRMQRSFKEGTFAMDVRTSSWISDWNPENDKFWNAKGKFIARRNLI